MKYRSQLPSPTDAPSQSSRPSPQTLAPHRGTSRPRPGDDDSRFGHAPGRPLSAHRHAASSLELDQLDSVLPSGFADTGSSFGDSDFGTEPRPRRTASGPVESWHDSSYVLRRGLEVRELSAREWRLCVSEPLSPPPTSAPSLPSAPRRRVDGAGDA